MPQAMRREKMPMVKMACMGSVLSKIAGAEEGGFHAVGLQHVQDAVGALARHLHAFIQGEVYSVFARHVKLLCVKT